MSSLAQRTIGFYLQMEDHLSPVLRDAGKGYQKFVNALEKYNQRAYKASSRGMSQLAALVHDFERLPAVATRSYDKAMKTMAMMSNRVITQRVRLDIALPSLKDFRKTIQRAVMDGMQRALKKVKLNLSAALPKRRQSNLFDTSSALRKQYKGLVNPVDYSGNMMIPKFSGGKTGAVGGGPVKDDMLAMISSKEWVQTPDQMQKIIEALTDKKMGSGKFDADIIDVAKELINARKQLDILVDRMREGEDVTAEMNKAMAKAVVEIGFAKDSMKTWRKEGEALEPVIALFAKDLDRSVKATDKNVRDWKMMEKSVEEVRKDTREIDKNTKFLALRQALADVYHWFSDLASTARDAFGGSGMDDFVTSMNHANRVLDMSRDSLYEVKSAVADLSSAQGGAVSLSEMGEAFNGLAQAGMRGADALTEFAVPVVEIAKITGRSSDAVADDMFTMVKAFKMTKQQGTATLLTLRNIANKTGTSFDALADSAKKHAKNSGAWMRKLGTEGAKAATENMARIQGAMNSQVEGLGDAMTDLVSRAAGGDYGALGQISQLTGGFVASKEQLQEMLKTGQGMEQMLAGFGKGLGDNEDQLRATADVLNAIGGGGFDADMLAGGAANANKMAEALKGIGSAATVATKDAENVAHSAAINMQTWWETLRNQITTGIGSMFTGAIDFFKEFNPMVVLSTIQLGQMAMNGVKVMSGWKLWGNLGRTILVPLMATLGTLWTTVLLPALTALGAGLVALSAPVWLIVGAIAAVVAGIIYFRKEIWALIEGVYEGFKEMLMPLVDQVWAAIMDVWAGIKLAFAPIIDLFSELFGGSDSAGSSLQWLVEIGKVVGKVFGWITKVVFTPLVWVLQAIGKSFQLIGWIIGNTIGFVVAIGKAVWKLITGDFQGAGDVMMSWASGAFESLKGILGGILDFIGGIFKSIGGFIADAVGVIWEMMQWWGDVMSYPFQVMWDVAKSVFGLIADGIGGMVSSIGSVFSTLGGIITAPIDTAVSAVSAVYDNTVGPIVSGVKGVWDWFFGDDEEPTAAAAKGIANAYTPTAPEAAAAAVAPSYAAPTLAGYGGAISSAASSIEPIATSVVPVTSTGAVSSQMIQSATSVTVAKEEDTAEDETPEKIDETNALLRQIAGLLAANGGMGRISNVTPGRSRPAPSMSPESSGLASFGA